MANPVVHFEIHASEPQKLIDFYSGLLGWQFSQFGDAPYWSIVTGASGEPIARVPVRSFALGMY